MRIEDVKLGMRVVPISKSKDSSLAEIMAIDHECPNFLRSEGYLFVVKICTETGEVECWHDKNSKYGDQYLVSDLIPYDEIETDNVNHPNHYQHGGIETLDYIKAVISEIENPYEAYVIGNALKYISRQHKKNGIEDIKKTVYYLNDLIKCIEKDDVNE